MAGVWHYDVRARTYEDVLSGIILERELFGDPKPTSADLDAYVEKHGYPVRPTTSAHVPPRRMPAPAPPKKPLGPCAGCGAPGEPTICSYCRSPRET